MERVCNQEQIGRLQPRALGRAIYLAANIARAADRQIRLFAKEFARFPGHIEQICDLPRLPGRPKLACALCAYGELTERRQAFEDYWKFKFCNRASLVHQASPRRVALTPGSAEDRSGTRVRSRE
jgi:hypothetical protein